MEIQIICGRACTLSSLTLDIIKHLMGMAMRNGTQVHACFVESLTLLYMLQQQAPETGIKRN